MMLQLFVFLSMLFCLTVDAQQCSSDWSEFVVRKDSSTPFFRVDGTSGDVEIANKLKLGSVNDVAALLSALSTRVAAVESKLAAAANVPFTTWGTRLCASGSTLIYDGWIMGAKNGHGGSSSVHCMPRQFARGAGPDGVDAMSVGDNDDKSLLTSAEFRTAGNASPMQLAAVFQPLDGLTVPCSKCTATNKYHIMTINGQASCPSGWQKLYEGCLMGMRHDQSPRDQLCIHQTPQGFGTRGGSGSSYLLYFAEVRSTSQQSSNPISPPYLEEAELKCVVCAK